MHTVQFAVVDAFALRPFSGNPVAIVEAEGHIDDILAQQIAGQFNLSETTFIDKRSDGDFDIRIFTPVNQLPLAGHPLLGTAAYLGSAYNRRELTMHTRGGLLRARINDSHVELEQPMSSGVPYERALEAQKALGVRAPTSPVKIYDVGPRHVLVGCENTNQLDALTPDHHALASHIDVAFICYAPTAEGVIARMFSPAYGVVEDAATGSAAVPLLKHAQTHHAHLGNLLHIVQGRSLGRESHITALHTPGDSTGWVSGMTRLRMDGRLRIDDVV